MNIELNSNIVIEEKTIVNSKASEVYVSVVFSYEQEKYEYYVPIEYRRTGLSIDFSDKNTLYTYLNWVYEELNPNKFSDWCKEQEKFWKTKPNASTTKAFYDKLIEGGWKCGACEMPRNPNPQRRIQDLKEFGYMIATDLSRYCPVCQKIQVREFYYHFQEERMVETAMKHGHWNCASESFNCLAVLMFMRIHFLHIVCQIISFLRSDGMIKQKLRILTT